MPISLRRPGKRSTVLALAVAALLSFGTLAGAAPAYADPIIGSISGTVLGTTANGPVPLAGVTVQAFGTSADGGWTVTDADGNYVISGLEPDDFTVGFYADPNAIPRYLDQVYDQADWQDPTPVTVTAGTVSSVDATLELAAQLSGTVTDATSGTDIAAADMDVVAYSGGIEVAATTTDVDGNYTFDALAGGDYTVGFGIYQTATSLIPEYYDETYDPSDATPISLAAGDSVTGIDSQLSEVRASVVPGTVTISGTALVGQQLTADAGSWSPVGTDLYYQWLRDGAPIDNATEPTYTVTTADQGHALSAQVTGAWSLYDPATATSAPIAVAAATSTVTPASTSVASSLANTGLDLATGWLAIAVLVLGGAALTFGARRSTTIRSPKKSASR